MFCSICFQFFFFVRLRHYLLCHMRRWFFAFAECGSAAAARSPENFSFSSYWNGWSLNWSQWSYKVYIQIKIRTENRRGLCLSLCFLLSIKEALRDGFQRWHTVASTWGEKPMRMINYCSSTRSTKKNNKKSSLSDDWWSEMNHVECP